VRLLRARAVPCSMPLAAPTVSLVDNASTVASEYLPGDAGEERDAVLGNSRRLLVVCDQCSCRNPAIALHSARANSESQQPVRCAAGPTGSAFAGFGLFSRIIPRGY
jgi:hypothetical protein